MKISNKEIVSEASIDFFVKGMLGHNAVRNISPIDKVRYLIQRTKGRRDIKVLLADIYILAEVDIIEIKSKYRDIDCIVLIGFNNKYSMNAKILAKQFDLALFDSREFFGAINFTGDEFISYELHQRND